MWENKIIKNSIIKKLGFQIKIFLISSNHKLNIKREIAINNLIATKL